MNKTFSLSWYLSTDFKEFKTSRSTSKTQFVIICANVQADFLLFFHLLKSHHRNKYSVCETKSHETKYFAKHFSFKRVFHFLIYLARATF